MYVFDWKLRSNPVKYIAQSLLAVLSIGVILLFLDLKVQTAIIASLGATAFTVFTRPRHFTSSCRTVLGGYAVGVASGVVFDIYIRGFFPPPLELILAGGLATGVAVFIMVSTNTEHPPAAGAALGIVLNSWNINTLVFIFSSVVMMLLLKRVCRRYMINLIGEEHPPHMGMRLHSPAFAPGERLPDKYTCFGEEVSPPFEISNVPREAESLVLTLTDSDGILGLREHWLLWNIPPDTSEIREGELPPSVSGTNDFGRRAYVGPLPHSRPHRYVFRVYALSRTLDIPPGSGIIKLEKAMGCHVLDKSSLRCFFGGECGG